MKKTLLAIGGFVLGVVIVLTLIGAVLGVAFLGAMFIAWLLYWAVKGCFHYEMAYWPTVALWMVVNSLFAGVKAIPAIGNKKEVSYSA